MPCNILSFIYFYNFLALIFTLSHSYFIFFIHSSIHPIILSSFHPYFLSILTTSHHQSTLSIINISNIINTINSLIFNITPGASSDIQQATKIAKMMVTKWGMSDKVGLFFVDDKDKQSGEFQQLIDDEVTFSNILSPLQSMIFTHITLYCYM